MAHPEAGTFDRLDDVNPEVVGDFVSLLSLLSSKFADKSAEAQCDAADSNLRAALNRPESTAVFVHRDVTNRIVSTATANVVTISEESSKEGWIDDVVTLVKSQKQGLARAAMHELHEWFTEHGVNTVRLTSSHKRTAAGNLYENVGYVQSGEVWRAPLNESTTSFTLAASGLFTPLNCTIPTGNKAWVYGPYTDEHDVSELTDGLLHANGTLRQTGITSVNYFSETPTSLAMTAALEAAGYEERDTRLYTFRQN